MESLIINMKKERYIYMCIKTIKKLTAEKNLPNGIKRLIE